jgi:hypothetical protein
MSAYLLVLGHRDGLRWVLDHDAMAFAEHRAGLARRVCLGDELFLYTTRGCFLNPTRGRSRVIGKARATAVATSGDPIEVADQAFGTFLNIGIETLAPFPCGVDFAEIVTELRAFPPSGAWAARLRAPLVALEREDATLLDGLLTGGSVDEAKESYRRWTPGVRLASGRPGLHSA